MRKELSVVGHGGGGGGQEEGDTLFSKSKLSVIELISEGEIFGLVNGAKSIYLNDIPLESAIGTKNFKTFAWEQRTGTPTQDYFAGFDSAPSPFQVNHLITTESPGIFSVVDGDVDKIRVIVKFPSLIKQTNDGTVTGTKVEYSLAVKKNGGAEISVGTFNVSGKSSSTYEKQHVIDLAPYKPASTWEVVIRRITPDSTSTSITDKMYLESYVEIKSVKLNYPNSAVIKVDIDPMDFTGIPKRSYHVKGIKVRVPSNYDPETATYNGDWNGSFISRYSNNPAWVMLDLLSNKRYGMGIEESSIDVYQLYAIAQYCDQLIPDGYGGSGMERRFTVNTVINTRGEAYKLVSDLSSVFRGMAYWAQNMVGFTQDTPKSAGLIYNASNVIDGEFTYTSSSKRSRHNVVLVTWNDPKSNYKQVVEYVEDAALIRDYGEIRQIEIVAFGCTSRGQAHRAGRWVLMTESYESNVVTFKVGMDSALALPGEMIKIQDSHRAGRRMGGRVANRSANGLNVTLDYPITLEQAGATIYIKTADGAVYSGSIQNAPGEYSTLSVTPPIPELAEDAVFVVNEVGLVTMNARIVSISQEKDGVTFSISALQYQNGKFDAIDNGGPMLIDQIVPFDQFNLNPQNLYFAESTYLAAPGVVAVRLSVSWQGRFPKYEIKYRVSQGELDPANPGKLRPINQDGIWVTFEQSGLSFVKQDIIGDQIVDVIITGIGKEGNRSPELIGTHDVKGKTSPPAPPTNLVATGGLRIVTLKWVPPADLDLDKIVIYRQDDLGTVPQFTDVVGRVPYATVSGNATTFVDSIQSGLTTKYYWVAAVDTSGNQSDVNAQGGTPGTTLYESSDIMQLLTDVSASVKNTQLYQDIVGGISLDLFNTAALPVIADGLTSQQQQDALADALVNENINVRGLAENLVDSFGRIHINDTRIENIATAEANGTKRIDTLAVQMGKNSSSILNLQDVLVTDKEAIATKFNDVSQKVNDDSGRITTVETVTVSNNNVLVSAVRSLEGRVASNNAVISTLIRDEATSRVTQDQAIANTLHLIDVKYQGAVDTLNANIVSKEEVVVTATSAAASKIDAMRASLNADVQATIAAKDSTSVGYCVLNGSPNPNYPDQVSCAAAGGVWRGGLPLADYIKQLKITSGTSSLTIEQQMLALSDDNGNLNGQYTLKIEKDVNNKRYVTGFGLATGAPDAYGDASSFIVAADKFAIVPSSTGTIPNSVDYSITPFTISGGQVFINKAIIGSATVGTFMLENQAVITPVYRSAPNAYGTKTTYNPNVQWTGWDGELMLDVFIPTPPAEMAAKKPSLMVFGTCVKAPVIPGSGNRVSNFDLFRENGDFVAGYGTDGYDVHIVNALIENLDPGTHRFYLRFRGETGCFIQQFRIMGLLVKS